VFVSIGLLVVFLTVFSHVAYESAAREQRMRTEMSQAKRETQFYLESVDKQKEISAIEQRKRKRGQETEVCVKYTYNCSGIVTLSAMGTGLKLHSLRDNLMRNFVPTHSSNLQHLIECD
jgi:hypothetical protein